jgi:hypothetical protein
MLGSLDGEDAGGEVEVCWPTIYAHDILRGALVDALAHIGRCEVKAGSLSQLEAALDVARASLATWGRIFSRSTTVVSRDSGLADADLVRVVAHALQHSERVAAGCPASFPVRSDPSPPACLGRLPVACRDGPMTRAPKPTPGRTMCGQARLLASS